MQYVHIKSRIQEEEEEEEEEVEEEEEAIHQHSFIH
jgi:hypothetical protein